MRELMGKFGVWNVEFGIYFNASARVGKNKEGVPQITFEAPPPGYH